MPHGTIQPVIPILLFAFVAVGAGIFFIVLGYVCNPRRSNPVKQMPYESGMDPIHPARRRMDVRFHLLAIAFLVFDVEILILYPWAVAFLADRPGADASARSAASTGAALANDGVPESPVAMRTGGRLHRSAEQPPSEASLRNRVAGNQAGNSASAPPAEPITAKVVQSRTTRAEMLRATASTAKERPPYVFATGIVFLLLLVLGYAYDWRKGVFDWL